jgi:hypothetical protein
MYSKSNMHVNEKSYVNTRPLFLIHALPRERTNSENQAGVSPGEQQPVQRLFSAVANCKGGDLIRFIDEAQFLQDKRT